MERRRELKQGRKEREGKRRYMIRLKGKKKKIEAEERRGEE